MLGPDQTSPQSYAGTNDDLYPGLLAANRTAFQAQHFETAYHALMAALHAAEDGRDYRRLEEVAAQGSVRGHRQSRAHSRQS